MILCTTSNCHLLHCIERSIIKMQAESGKADSGIILSEMRNDYIHYNPVKHSLVKSPFEWRYSSIHEYKEYYQTDWEKKEFLFEGDYGE